MSPALVFGSARLAVPLTIVYSIILIIGAVIPTTQPTSVSFSDKVWHAVAYGLHAGLLFWTAFVLGRCAIHSGAFALVGACCVGMATEVLQLFVPHRAFQLGDLAADAAGAAAVAGFCVLALAVSTGREKASGAVERHGS